MRHYSLIKDLQAEEMNSEQSVYTRKDLLAFVDMYNYKHFKVLVDTWCNTIKKGVVEEAKRGNLHYKTLVIRGFTTNEIVLGDDIIGLVIGRLKEIFPDSNILYNEKGYLVVNWA